MGGKPGRTVVRVVTPLTQPSNPRAPSADPPRHSHTLARAIATRGVERVPSFTT
jgi:hypothetical protein